MYFQRLELDFTSQRLVHNTYLEKSLQWGLTPISSETAEWIFAYVYVSVATSWIIIQNIFGTRRDILMSLYGQLLPLARSPKVTAVPTFTTIWIL